MNHIYRIVKNKKTGLWTAVCEIARANSGSAASAVVVAAVGFSLGAPLAMAADPSAVPIAGARTTAAMAANNVTTIITIDAANAAGLSHNKYSVFNVNAGGLILNNADGINNLTVNTQLAGQILANQNLTQSAKVILNEVLSTNPSLLNGFTEVAGTKADILIANYNGITCASCGFINTGRTTLSTGTPILDASGALLGLRVSQGLITVEGTGLNATGSDLMDLVSRGIKVDGPINANILEAHTGVGAWQYNNAANPTSLNKTSEAVTGAGNTPAFAIDTSALGGMYANTIRLVATGAGVGVNMLGEVAASTGDFSMDASGKIVIKGKISAARDLNLTTSDSSSGAAAAVQLTNAPLSAKQDVKVTAAGEVNVQGGQL